MKNKYCSKLIPFIVILISVLNLSVVSAEEITKRSDYGIDENLSEKNSVEYSQPGKILVSQVKGFDSKLANDSAKWVRLLYYYSITKLGLSDLPYNYLIDESGMVFEGQSGGAGANPNLSNGQNAVLIGILSSKTTLTPRTSLALEELVENLSYKYGIDNGKYETVTLSIAKKEGNISSMTADAVAGTTFSDSVSQSMENVSWSKEEHLSYKAVIESVEYPAEIVIGETLKVTVKIKNDNDFTWFGDSDYIYISTKDSKDSPYAINSVWESFSKPTHIDKSFVKPGESVDVSFELLAKSKPGKYTAEFNLVKSPKTTFENSDIKIDFSVGAGDYKLVQVASPDYGFVNIRECRWYSCEKVEVANNGDVFIVVKKEEGWYEIEYKKGSKGWVYQKYVKEL